MSQGRFEFVKVATGGPVAYVWHVDQVPTNAKSGVASLNALMDEFKTLAATLPGAIIKGSINISTDG
jgi:hypothetical protein